MFIISTYLFMKVPWHALKYLLTNKFMSRPNWLKEELRIKIVYKIEIIQTTCFTGDRYQFGISFWAIKLCRYR